MTTGDRSRGVGLAVAVVVGMACASASAQDYTYPTPPPQNQPYTTEPEYAPPPEPKVGDHRGLQGGFTIGVPIWFDVDRDVVRPGADLQFFGGYDIGYAMFGLNLGAMWTPIDLNQVANLPPGLNPGRSPLTRLYISPEARVQVPNKSPILPYLAAAFDINWWRFRDTEVRCNFWYCTSVAVFEFTPGFTGKVGVGLRARNGVHIDVGIKYSLSGAGNFFNSREQWVTPYVGVLVR
ncbi:MAG: hypothetical protein AAF436_19245 [Myxococcota bacterium]